MLSFLQEAGLSAQNKLFDHTKKSLYAMSMTDLYAIAIVSELAFVKGITTSAEIALSPSLLRPKIVSAVGLIGSCAELIATIWIKPEPMRDGTVATQSFLENHGQSHVVLVQQLVKKHIAKIRDQCSMADCDA